VSQPRFNFRGAQRNRWLCPRRTRRMAAGMPHRRGGGTRSAVYREVMSMRERFRRWALVYWPEALERRP
jgi:hypothetical protein